MSWPGCWVIGSCWMLGAWCSLFGVRYCCCCWQLNWIFRPWPQPRPLCQRLHKAYFRICMQQARSNRRLCSPAPAPPPTTKTNQKPRQAHSAQGYLWQTGGGRGHWVLGLRAGVPIPLSQCPRVLLATVATICQTHFLCNFGPKVAKIFARLAKNKAAPYDPSRHPHTHTLAHTLSHTHVCPRLLCRTLQLNPFLIFLAINFYHFGISLWNATPTRNHLRPLTIYVHNGFACVCVPGQTKVFFSSFFSPIMKKPQDKNEPNK